MMGTAIVLALGLTGTGIACLTESPVVAPVCLFPYLIGAMFGGAHTPSSLGFIVGLVLEWGLIGYLLSGLVYLFITPGPAQRTAGKEEQTRKGPRL